MMPLTKYSQATDPSLTPFLKGGKRFIGEDAAEKQANQKRPSAEEVRVDAHRGPHQRAGAGLHEVLPTNMRDAVADSGDPIAIGVQSGLRTATDMTLLYDQTGNRVAGHTGFFPLPQGGSSNTGGQADAHNALRILPHGATPEEAVLNAAANQVRTLAHGQQILASDNITGGIPNFVGAGAVEPPAAAGAPPGPTRAVLAHVEHEQREHIKQRTATEEAARGLPRSVSFEREPVNPLTGMGGGYITDPSLARRASLSPEIDPGTAPWHLFANLSSYLTAPLRHNAHSVTSTVGCPHCGTMNRPTLLNCVECKRPLPPH